MLLIDEQRCYVSDRFIVKIKKTKIRTMSIHHVKVKKLWFKKHSNVLNFVLKIINKCEKNGEIFLKAKGDYFRLKREMFLVPLISEIVPT